MLLLTRHAWDSWRISSQQTSKIIFSFISLPPNPSTPALYVLLFIHFKFSFWFISSTCTWCKRVKQLYKVYSLKTVISSPPPHLLLLFQLWLSLLALGIVSVNNTFYTTDAAWFLRWRYWLSAPTMENGKCGSTFLSHPRVCLLPGFLFFPNS